MPLAARAGRSASSCERARLVIQGRNTGCLRQQHLVGRAHYHADYWHHSFLARPYPAGKNRREEKAPADEGDPMSLPAFALLWRVALAPGVAVDLLETGALQD